MIDPDLENKEIEEFRAKGEKVIHREITLFAYNNNIKQLQLVHMTGLRKEFVSVFTSGEYLEFYNILSEDNKIQIYKWYLRFLKYPSIYREAYLLAATPRKCRFKFHKEHLEVIIFKCFIFFMANIKNIKK